MYRLAFTCLFTFLSLATVTAQDEFPLYPGEIPNARDVPETERIEARATGGRAVYATSVPTLRAFVPEHPNGKALIICPGGGYVKTAIDKEGVLVAEALLQDSLTVFVLKYRIPQEETNVVKSLAPLQDVQQAIRYVRQNAGKYGIASDHIGVMGFSAGGHLAATAATLFAHPADPNEPSKTSIRPDFVALIYPVISFSPDLRHAGSRTSLLGKNPTAAEDLKFSADRNVTAASPPAFLVHAANDRAVPVGNSLAYYQACIDNDVPAEMHLYAAGGHGFGLNNRTTPDRWLNRFRNWLQTR